VGGPNTQTTNPRWPTAAILNNQIIAIISSTVGPIGTKFGKLTHADAINTSAVKISIKKSNSELLKIQDGKRPVYIEQVAQLSLKTRATRCITTNGKILKQSSVI